MEDTTNAAPVSGTASPVPLPGAYMTKNPSFDSESEEALELRYGRSKKKDDGLVFEFTRDPALLHQYYRIYEDQFRVVHNATRYKSMQDEHDRFAKVVIVRRGDLCLGGARLSVKTPRQRQLLPIEINEFRIEDHFPHLGQNEMRYGQIGRICLLPDYRGGAITRQLMWNLYRKVLALGLDEVFGTATIPNARVYRQNCVAMGLKNVRIHLDIDLPRYPMCEEIKFYLISGTVDKVPLAKDAVAVDSSEADIEKV